MAGWQLADAAEDGAITRRVEVRQVMIEGWEINLAIDLSYTLIDPRIRY